MNYIFSKLSDKGLFNLNGINIIGDIFGLIGVYKKNKLNEKHYDDSTAYNILIAKYDEQYLNNEKKHGIRNIGEIDIKLLLENDNFYLSRRDFRFFSQTWTRVPVISFLKSDVIFTKTIERVHDNPILWKVAREKIFKFNDDDDCIMKILEFQYANVCLYLIGSESAKKRKFKRMFENWQNNEIIKYLGK